MTAAKHTPGPWKVLPPEDGATYLRIRGTALGLRFKVANVLHAPCEEEGACEHPVEAEITEANARLIAATPELLAELQAAHQIIRNALALMGPGHKTAWAKANDRAGVIGEGTTRANEREAVLAKATGAAA